MKIKISGTTNEQFIKRMYFLAYQNSRVMGLGALRAVSEATEDAIFKNIDDHGDYAMKLGIKKNEYYADYVFGRMMKLGCSIEDDCIIITDKVYAPDYQSFARVYKDASALLNATAQSLNCTYAKEY